MSPSAPAVDAAACTPAACTPAADAHALGADAAAQLAPVLKALGDPLRLRMLSFVATSATGEACVCDIASVADVSQPTVSHHLKVLKDVGVLTSQRRGTWVYYRVEPALRGALATLLDAFVPAVLGTTPEPTTH
ncbi:ArsR/SmtB family transcription factor [Cellulomonas xiejunii]|uniref:ArsR/SmtB family transcription factor n=1 Tax=Cellulomonas xiejunii TaxID=2968083 RepID=UPI001D0E9893|nr:metalloregulator ArsR/SmtB family transcription factor [Cellulomonas xiejunii]MCC2314036.1 metalloregulator ArsR/SmtB family transcription factor [Cellulomonas xiejunii]